MTKPVQERFYTLNESNYPEDGTSLNAIASKFYGRTYKAQQTGRMLDNDSVYEYLMDRKSVDQWCYDMKEKRHYLGIQRVLPGTGDSGGDYVHHYAEGVNWFDYWLALKFDPNKPVVYVLPDQSNLREAMLSQYDPAEWEDARGHVFGHESGVYRKAPTPNYVLADLIRNGVLPYGKYLLRVSW